MSPKRMGELTSMIQEKSVAVSGAMNCEMLFVTDT
jgi:hypothetical protein